VSDPSRRCCHSANYCFPVSAGNESNYRTSAYEAITSFVQQATVDCVQVVSNTTLKILDRMEHLLNVQVRRRRI
jgi:hypothetical protein